ncbi:hypothetical protein BJ508DRAFT_377182 [Ascobolus immersus RN42]|uniref:Uncharacterized protein n=1 Tax=Ascobolus immersus RN42 TaxID=1160509 RepID=A0A3N4I4B6_ASCIM|nr:hypothetical protein BJ508DRAFT_377182 [Ascobolus immersus RN42]
MKATSNSDTNTRSPSPADIEMVDVDIFHDALESLPPEASADNKALVSARKESKQQGKSPSTPTDSPQTTFPFHNKAFLTKSTETNTTKKASYPSFQLTRTTETPHSHHHRTSPHKFRSRWAPYPLTTTGTEIQTDLQHALAARSRRQNRTRGWIGGKAKPRNDDEYIFNLETKEDEVRAVDYNSALQRALRLRSLRQDRSRGVVGPWRMRWGRVWDGVGGGGGGSGGVRRRKWGGRRESEGGEVVPCSSAQ